MVGNRSLRPTQALTCEITTRKSWRRRARQAGCSGAVRHYTTPQHQHQRVTNTTGTARSPPQFPRSRSSKQRLPWAQHSASVHRSSRSSAAPSANGASSWSASTTPARPRKSTSADSSPQHDAPGVFPMDFGAGTDCCTSSSWARCWQPPRRLASTSRVWYTTM